jgi:hypothetical protein
MLDCFPDRNQTVYFSSAKDKLLQFSADNSKISFAGKKCSSETNSWDQALKTAMQAAAHQQVIFSRTGACLSYNRISR